MNPVHGLSPPPFSAVNDLPREAPVEPRLSGPIGLLQFLGIFDARLETSLLCDYTKDVLDAEAQQRLREALHGPHRFQLEEGEFQDSLAAVIQGAFREFNIHPRKVEIAGSYVYKILGWNFVLNLFKKAGCDLESRLSAEDLDRLRKNFERAPSDIDIRIYLPLEAGEAQRKILFDKLQAYLQERMGGIVKVHPWENFNDPQTKDGYVISGLGTPKSLSAEILWIENLSREELFRHNGMRIRIPPDYLADPDCPQRPEWDSGDASPLKRTFDKCAQVVTVKDPLEVNWGGWGKLIVEFARGGILADEGTEQILLNNALLRCADRSKGLWLRKLLRHAMRSCTHREKLEVVRQACLSLRRCRCADNVLYYSEDIIQEMFKDIFESDLMDLALGDYLEPQGGHRSALALQLFDHLTGPAGIDDSLHDFIQTAIPEMKGISKKYSPEAFIEYLLTLPAWRRFAWDIYREKKIKTPSLSDFLLHYVKLSASQGVHLLSEVYDTILPEEGREAIEWIFNNFSTFQPETLLSLRVKFLAKHMDSVSEGAVAGMEGTAIYPQLLERVAVKGARVPGWVALSALLKGIQIPFFIEKALAYLELKGQKLEGDSLELLLSFRGNPLFLKIVPLLSPQNQLAAAQVIFDEFSAHNEALIREGYADERLSRYSIVSRP